MRLNLSRFHEAVAALPGFFESCPNAGFFVGGGFGVGVVDELRGFDFGQFEQSAIAEQVGDAEVGETGLAGSEELAGATELAREKKVALLCYEASACDCHRSIVARRICDVLSCESEDL